MLGRNRGFLAAGGLLLGLFWLQPSGAGIGTAPERSSENSDFEVSERSISQSLFAATGRLALSVDGGGALGSAYTVQANKPSSVATVRQAFLLAVSTGYQSYQIPNGSSGVRLNGTAISWSRSTPSAISSWNYAADVTSLVKPVLDAALVGRTSFNITEGNSFLTEGVVLAVVFDDPAQARTSTVNLLFGAQNTAGDSFSIQLASPLNPSTPGTVLTMGLGISFGAQFAGPIGNQYSTIDVNGQRLSSSAGGNDDGEGGDGALITVGGLDDQTSNPANPNGGHNNNPRTDDELYSLLPYINNSTTQISVATRNPSNDDNIFFAYFQISGSATVTTGTCQANATTLCIDDVVGDQRFKVQLGYSTAQGGGTAGDAKAIPLAPLGVRRGGLFWFFSNDNPEMMVKVLNGCTVNNRFWVFYSAGTNVGFDLTITDTKTGLVWTSNNPDLTLARSVGDVEAFPCQ